MNEIYIIKKNELEDNKIIGSQYFAGLNMNTDETKLWCAYEKNAFRFRTLERAKSFMQELEPLAQYKDTHTFQVAAMNPQTKTITKMID